VEPSYSTGVIGPSQEEEVLPEAWGADQRVSRPEESAFLYGWRAAIGVALGLAVIALVLVLLPR
jgi:hypothetical protein